MRLERRNLVGLLLSDAILRFVYGYLTVCQLRVIILPLCKSAHYKDIFVKDSKRTRGCNALFVIA